MYHIKRAMTAAGLSTVSPTILTARATEKRKLADIRFSRLKRGGMLRLIIRVCI